MKYKIHNKLDKCYGAQKNRPKAAWLLGVDYLLTFVGTRPQ